MIHPTSQIDPKAELDSSVEVGPWCVVGPGVRIKKGTRLHSHVVIRGNTEIGEENDIFPFAVLGGIPQDLKYRGEDTRLIVGDKNTIRECVTLNLGTTGGGAVTRVGNHNLLMAYSHLGHDSILHDHCVIANAVQIAGHVVVHDYATLGGSCGVVQFVRVGAHAYVGGHSGLEKDVPPFSIAVGTRPTLLKGANIVGLRRKGFTTETIQKLNEAIKLWARSDVPREQCLLEIESQFGDLAEIRHLLAFLRESKAGVIK